MGCEESHLATMPERLGTKVGMLVVTVKSIHIEHRTSSLS